MSEKIFLTRNQLAKFLPTPEAIKAFENLFKIATQQTPNNIDEVQISAESALSMANYSLSVLDNVSKLIEALELQPPEIPTISEDVIDVPIVNINECECLEIIKEPDWNFIKNHPTTISGYGITDAYTQVVADSPLTGNGTTSSHLSIPAATSLVSGYLLNTDWSTFNSKQSAYTNLSSIGSLANSSGWLHNDGSGVFAYSTPTKSDVGLSNVTNNAQVTSVSGTSPINSSGGTAPTISIDKADATHNGYLSNTDWSTFNSKQSALTTGNLTETTSSILTITGGTGAIIGSGTTIAVTKSDSTHNGYLSSTDWSTFNSKEPAQTKGSITEATSSVLTITNGSNSTVGPNVTIQVKQSTNAVSGYLSSTDWTTFNGKQVAYTNLTSIGGLANSLGWLKNNGSGTFSYSTPTATDVGLGNVTNESKATMFSSPALTGTPTAPTASVNTSTTQIATTAFVNAEIANDAVPRITSTDNAIARYDGTGGAIQNSSVVIDDSGNLGIGVTPSAWRSGWKALQIGARASYISGTSGQPIIAYNSYMNTSNQWVYSATGVYASNYEQSDGSHFWYITTTTGTADNPITWNTAMMLNHSGNLGIGTDSPSYKLHLSSDSAAKPSTNTWTISSDERLKENIELADLDRCYEIVKTIPLKRYTWKDSVYTQEQVSDRSKLGWIAQDVKIAFPKAVNIHKLELNTTHKEIDAEGNEIDVNDSIDDCLDLNADQLYAVMYGAIQKLQAKIEALEMTKQS